MNYQSRFWVGVVLAVILFLATGQPLMAQSGAYDPLSKDEINRALTTALQAGVAGGAESELSAANVNHEVLLIERNQPSKAELQSAAVVRRGDVYIYDYNTDTLKHAVVDLTTNETIAVTEMQNVQLPLTERETNAALDLIFAHEQLRTELSRRYQSITGDELTSIDLLEVKAFIFRADSMPDRVNEMSAVCGLHRCAQVLLYTEGDTIMEMQPIVDLSRRNVTQEISTDFVLNTAPVDLSGQAVEQVDTLFLPFIGRTRLGELMADEAALEQEIFSLWCTLFGGTQIDAFFGGACSG